MRFCCLLFEHSAPVDDDPGRDLSCAADAAQHDLLHRIVRAAVIGKFGVAALKTDRVEEAAGRADAAADAAVGVDVAHAAGEAVVHAQLVRGHDHVVPTEGAEAARVSGQGLAVPGVEMAVDAFGRFVAFFDLPGGILLFDGEELRIDRGVCAILGAALRKANAQLLYDRLLRRIAELRLAEHGHGIAGLCQEICAAQLRPARADHGHGQLIVTVLALQAYLMRHELIGKLPLHARQARHRRADCHRRIDAAAHADLFAAVIAALRADGREGVILPHQLQRVEEALLFDKLQHTLDGYMRRAGAFAGRRAAWIAVDLVAVPVIRMPVFLAPVPRLGGEGLVSEGVEGIGYITEEELGLSSDLDSQIDGVHANDIGMRLYADAYLNKISSLLDYHPLALYRPVRQRRDAPGYEWPIRHDRVVTRNRTTDPEILLIGNSITHYWSGEPYDPHHSGVKSWHKLFGKRRVTNMGFGWDRIENIFWRFYHGELDNCRPQHIFLMAGTNNIHQNTNEEIASGVRALVDFLRAKQPQAKVHVVKIYPRRGMEKRMEEINRLIARQMPDDGMIDIVDVTPQLTSSDGKIIEELFSDGLHPNEKGYERIASVYKKYIEK